MVYILISDPIVSIIQRAPLKGKIQMQTRISTRKTFFERLHCFRYKQSIKEGVQKSSLAVFWNCKYNFSLAAYLSCMSRRFGSLLNTIVPSVFQHS